MLLLAIRTIAIAVSSSPLPIASATRPTAARAASASSVMAPPRKLSGLIRPSTTLASVTVALSPPAP
jgi:hypothetical protein